MIEDYEFGRYRIDGKEYMYDITIVDGEIGTWDSRDTHSLKAEDVKKLVEAEPEIIVIGKGASGALDVPEDIIDYIKDNGIEAIIEDTGKACREYNRLVKEGRKVAAIMHGTC